jgi:hypothetical protein
VIEEAGPQIGQTQVKQGRPQVRAAVSIDTTKFEQELIDTLNNP